MRIYYESSHDVLFETLASVRLQKLVLRCQGWKVPCLFENTDFFNEEYNALATCCSNLCSLELYCHSDSHGSVEGNGTPFSQTLPDTALMLEVGLNGDVADNTVDRLRRLDSVKLKARRDACSLAAKIGSAVTELVSRPEERLAGGEITSLTACPRLSHLSASLACRADTSLAAAATVFRSLCSLDLRWDVHEIGVWSRDRVSYPSATAGAILRTVQELGELEVLHLFCVQIALTELTECLKCVGRRLRSFKTSILSQEEEPLVRLEELLYTTARWNVGLLRFHTGMEMGQRLGHCPGTETQLCHVRRAVRRLKQKAPYVDLGNLRAFVDFNSR